MISFENKKHIMDSNIDKNLNNGLTPSYNLNELKTTLDRIDIKRNVYLNQSVIDLNKKISEMDLL